MEKSLSHFKTNYNLMKNIRACTTNSNSSGFRYDLSLCYLKKINKIRQMNMMLISAVVAFFIFYAPYSIYYIILYNKKSYKHADTVEKATYGLIGHLLLLWSLLNVTFNFYFYYLTGSVIFRTELAKIKKSIQTQMK